MEHFSISDAVVVIASQKSHQDIQLLLRLAPDAIIIDQYQSQHPSHLFSLSSTLNHRHRCLLAPRRGLHIQIPRHNLTILIRVDRVRFAPLEIDNVHTVIDVERSVGKCCSG